MRKSRAPRDPNQPKRGPGRPRLNRTKEEQKALRNAKRKEAIARKNQESHSKTIHLQNFRIHEICDLRYPSDAPSWLSQTDEEKRLQRNAIHDRDHCYIVTATSSSADFAFYKIGPTRLPFASGFYAFDVEVERMPEDILPMDVSPRTLQKAQAGGARAVVSETLRIRPNPALSYPPTTLMLRDVMNASFPFDVASFEKRIQKLWTDIDFVSMDHFEEVMFERDRREHGENICDRTDGPDRGEAHVLRERCRWMLRESLLGPSDFFAMCRYFSPTTFVGATRRDMLAITRELVHPDQPERSALMLLYRLIRLDTVGGHFRNGRAMLDFIEDRVPDKRVRETLNAPAAWFDQLRQTYVKLVAAAFLFAGDMFPYATVQREQVEHVEYLVRMGFICVYEHLPSEHMKVAHAGAMLFLQKGTKPTAEDWVPPSSLGASPPAMIFPIAAIGLAQLTIEYHVKALASAYEYTRVHCLERALNGAIGRLNAPPYDGERSRLTPREIEFVRDVTHAFAGDPALYGSGGVLLERGLRSAFLQLDPDAPRPASFWEELCMLIEIDATHCKFTHEPYAARMRQRSDCNRAMVQLGCELLRYDIVIVDYPFAYSERKNGESRDFVDMARHAADVFVDPSNLASFDPYRRYAGRNRFVCISELEKWTLQQFKETLDMAFFDWTATDLVRGAKILWIIVDTHALDLGAVGVMDELARRTPSVRRISLRQRLVQESALAAVVAQTKLDALIENAMIGDYFIYTRIDCDTVTAEMLDGDDEVVLERVYEVPEFRLTALAQLQRADRRPMHAKVQLSAIHDLRQLYTYSCYVTGLMFLVGTPEMLRRICNASLGDLFLMSDGNDTEGQLRFVPRETESVWTSLRVPKGQVEPPPPAMFVY